MGPLPPNVDPLQFVIDKNVKRRHLNASQRAYAATKLAALPKGRPSKTIAQTTFSQGDAAALFGVSRDLVLRARQVQDDGTPELRSVVERGLLDVSAAAKAAKLAPKQQRQIAADATAGRVNVVRTIIKKYIRAERERELGRRQQAQGQKKGANLIGVFVEDFEWDFETWSCENCMDRHASNYYETAANAHTAAEIIERTKNRFEHAAPDCVLFHAVPGSSS